MKKIFIIALACSASLSAFGQGQLKFTNTTKDPIVGMPKRLTADTSTWYISGLFSSGALVATASNSPALVGVINAGSATTVPSDAMQTWMVRSWSQDLGTDWNAIAPKVDLSNPLAPTTTDVNWVGKLIGQSNSGQLKPKTLGTTDFTPILWRVDSGGVSGPLTTFGLFPLTLVPEPASASLIGLGLASLLIFRRRS